MFADVEPETAVVTAETVDAALTEKTAAVVPVHLYGRPAPVRELCELGLPVADDAA